MQQIDSKQWGKYQSATDPVFYFKFENYFRSWQRNSIMLNCVATIQIIFIKHILRVISLCILWFVSLLNQKLQIANFQCFVWKYDLWFLPLHAFIWPAKNRINQTESISIQFLNILVWGKRCVVENIFSIQLRSICSQNKRANKNKSVILTNIIFVCYMFSSKYYQFRACNWQWFASLQLILSLCQDLSQSFTKIDLKKSTNEILSTNEIFVFNVKILTLF